MRANKVTVTIVVEALSIDCLPHLVNQAVDHIEREFVDGKLEADDGDTVQWTTKSEAVRF